MSGSWPAIHPGISLKAYCQSLQNHSKCKPDFLVSSDVILQLVDRVQKVCDQTPEVQVDERLSQVDDRLDQVIKIVKDAWDMTKSLTATSLPQERTPPQIAADQGELRQLIQSTISSELAKIIGSPTAFMTQNKDFRIKVKIHDVAVKQRLQKKSYEAPGALVSATNKVIREAGIQVEVSDVQQLSSGDLNIHTKTQEDRQKLIDEAQKWSPGMATVAPDTYQVVMHNVRVTSIDLSLGGTAETIKKMLMENREWLQGDSQITHVRWLGENPENDVTSIVVNFSHAEDANAALDRGITWLGELKTCALFEGAHNVVQSSQQYPPGGLQHNKDAKTTAPDEGGTGIVCNKAQLMQPGGIPDDAATSVDALLDSIASQYIPVQASPYKAAITAAIERRSEHSVSVGFPPTEVEFLELEKKLRQIEIRELEDKIKKAKAVLNASKKHKGQTQPGAGKKRKEQTAGGQSSVQPEPKPEGKPEPGPEPKLEQTKPKSMPKPKPTAKPKPKPKPKPKACSQAVVGAADAQHNAPKSYNVGTHSQQDLNARTTSWAVNAGSMSGLVTGGTSPSKGAGINTRKGKKRKAPGANVNTLPLGPKKSSNSVPAAATLVRAGRISGRPAPTREMILGATALLRTPGWPRPTPTPAQSHSSVSGAVPNLKMENVESPGPRSGPAPMPKRVRLQNPGPRSDPTPMPKRVKLENPGPQSDLLKSDLQPTPKRVKLESPEPGNVLDYCNTVNGSMDR